MPPEWVQFSQDTAHTSRQKPFYVTESLRRIHWSGIRGQRRESLVLWVVFSVLALLGSAGFSPNPQREDTSSCHYRQVLQARGECIHFPHLLLLLFSLWVVSDSWRPHGLQHARPPYPSPSPGVHQGSFPLSWWCHPPNSSSCCPLLLLPSVFPSIRVFSNDAVCIRWP